MHFSFARPVYPEGRISLFSAQNDRFWVKNRQNRDLNVSNRAEIIVGGRPLIAGPGTKISARYGGY